MNPQEPINLAEPFSLPVFFQRLFTGDYMPHGHCYYWRSDLIGLHVFSDVLITVAYYLIPIILIYFVIKKREEVPFSWMFLMFGAFIFLCGTTHIFGIITIWSPVYRLEGIVKLITGLVSIATAILLIPIIPRLLKLPNMEKMILALSKKATELSMANENLERFNRAAVGREQRIIDLKKQVNVYAARLKEKPPYELPGLEFAEGQEDEHSDS